MKGIKIIIFIMSILLLSNCATGSNLSNKYKWKFEAGSAILSAPVINGGRVLFTNDKGSLSCLDKNTGEVIFKYESEGKKSSTPLIYGENIYYLNGSGDLLVINSESGQLIKSINLGKTNKKDEWDYFLSEPIIFEDSIYVGAGKKGFYSIDIETLDINWEFKTDSTVHNRAIVIDDIIIFADMSGKNYCLNRLSGELIWDMKSGDSVMGSYAYSDGLIYFGSRDTNTYAIDMTNGEIVWKYDHGHSWIMSTPVIHDNLVIVGGSDNHKVQAFNKVSGEEVWSTNVPYNIATVPVIVNDLIYYTAGDSYNTYGKGALFALDFKTGIKVYDFNTTSSFSSPVIDNSLAYFGTKSGNFFCVSLNQN